MNSDSSNQFKKTKVEKPVWDFLVTDTIVHVKSAISRKLLYITAQLRAGSLKHNDVTLAAPNWLTAGRRAEGLFGSGSERWIAEALRGSCTFFFLRFFYFIFKQAGRSTRLHARGSWLMSGGIASAISFFFLMKSEETHKQPKAGHTSCVFFPLVSIQ